MLINRWLSITWLFQSDSSFSTSFLGKSFYLECIKKCEASCVLVSSFKLFNRSIECFWILAIKLDLDCHTLFDAPVYQNVSLIPIDAIVSLTILRKWASNFNKCEKFTFWISCLIGIIFDFLSWQPQWWRLLRLGATEHFTKY